MARLDPCADHLGQHPAVGWSWRPLACSGCTARAAALIFAIGTNPVVSRLSGVPIRRLTLRTYVISGLCAGLAGLLLLS